MKFLATLCTVAALTGSTFGNPVPNAEPVAAPPSYPAPGPVPAPAPAPAPAPGTAPTPAQQLYQKTVLRHHNVHRANHSAADLVWGPNMAKYGLILAQRCVFAHNTSINDWGEGYGQNLQIGSPATQVSEAITNGWYNNEMQNFNGQYGKPSPDLANFGGWGHFTQLVWKGSLKVGCATYDCTSQGGVKDSNGNKIPGVPPYMTVCNYYPVGNVIGSFDKNVGRPLGKARVGANY